MEHINLKKSLFLLIHSPLVGPTTWKLVAEELKRRGYPALAPTLHDSPASPEPYWQQEASSVRQALQDVDVGQEVILVGHSGAGPILPAIRQAIDRQAAGYVFVDAGIPHGGISRLGLMEAEDSPFAADLRQMLSQGKRFPDWTEIDLQEILPDPILRKAVIQELQPRGMDFFSEPLPVFPGWPDAPCAYLQFTPSYDQDAKYAHQEGWPYHRIEAGHFHMLVEPVAVIDAILALISRFKNDE